MRNVSDDYVEKRLEEWAEWFSRGNFSGLGYPSKTMEQRLRDGGGILVKMTGPWIAPTNKHAEEIEDLVKEMSKPYPCLSTVLRKKYFCSPYKTVASIAKEVDLPVRTFHEHIRMAKMWLSGRLNNYRMDNKINIRNVA